MQDPETMTVLNKKYLTQFKFVLFETDLISKKVYALKDTLDWNKDISVTFVGIKDLSMKIKCPSPINVYDFEWLTLKSNFKNSIMSKRVKNY